MENETRYYKIPVIWESFGVIEVEAKSFDDAIEIFKRDANIFDLPDGEYVDDSFKCSWDLDNPDEVNEMKALYAPKEELDD